MEIVKEAIIMTEKFSHIVFNEMVVDEKFSDNSVICSFVIKLELTIIKYSDVNKHKTTNK